jgi:hypothetical protein
MVERVARAMFERMANKDTWDKRSHAFKASWIRDAKAALEASHHAELVEALRSVDRVVLEQRCERGTPWDLACVTIAQKVREHVAPVLAKIGGDPGPSSTLRDERE